MKNNSKYVIFGVALVAYYVAALYTESTWLIITLTVIAALIAWCVMAWLTAKKEADEKKEPGKSSSSGTATPPAPSGSVSGSSSSGKKSKKDLEDEEYKHVMEYLQKRKQEKK